MVAGTEATEFRCGEEESAQPERIREAFGIDDVVVGRSRRNTIKWSYGREIENLSSSVLEFIRTTVKRPTISRRNMIIAIVLASVFSIALLMRAFASKYG